MSAFPLACPKRMGRANVFDNSPAAHRARRFRSTFGAAVLLGLTAAIPAAAHGLPPKAIAAVTDQPDANLPTAAVQNVRVLNTFGRSVVVRWDAPQDSSTWFSGADNANKSTVSAYYVTWQATGEQTFESKVVGTEWGRSNATQVQPLDPAKTYTVTIAPMDTLGNKGRPYTIPNVKATGSYEAELKTVTGNGKTGFLYLPENDAANGRINPTKFANDIYGYWSGDAKGTFFDHASIALNGQQHWHMIGGDNGGGNVTARLRSPMALADGSARKLLWDCDRGPIARSGWYIVLTPNKMERLNLFPNFHDSEPTNNWPHEAIRIKVIGEGATATRVTNGNLTDSVTFNWRQNTYVNVRQRMGLTINQKGLTFQADANYDGTLPTRATLATDLSKWKECYVYLIMATYNQRKTTCVLGTSATGQMCYEYEGANMHWGNVAFDAPANNPPAEELSYYLENNLVVRGYQSYDGSKPFNITISDALPTDATGQELVFTDEGGSIPGLTGRDKLRVIVNGYTLPNKYLDTAYDAHPTYRWPLPTGLLKQGVNQVIVSETGGWEPFYISHIHLDIAVPHGSPSLLAWTPPPPHPTIETMPDHTEMEGWTIPRTALGINSNPVSGRATIPVYASAVETAHLAGNFVPIDKVWLDIDGQTVLTRDTNAGGMGTLMYKGGVTIDTSKLANGYHLVSLKAHLKSGSVAENHGQGMFLDNNDARLVVYNGPKATTAPKFERVQQGTTGTNSAVWADDAKGGTSFVNPGFMTVKTTIATPSMLKRVYLQNLNFTWIADCNFLEMSPALASPVAVPGGMRYNFTANLDIGYNWFWALGGPYRWNLVAIDVDGNRSDFPFNWSVVQNVPPPPGIVTSSPVVNAFSADPLTVHAGWATKLYWSVSGCDSVQIDNGIGSTYAGGAVTFVPLKTTTYTLTAKNAKGATTKQVTVTVIP